MMDASKLARRKAIRGFISRNKHDVVGGLIMLVMIAAMSCMILDMLDTEAVRQADAVEVLR